MVGHVPVPSLNLTYADGKRLLTVPLRVSHVQITHVAPGCSPAWPRLIRKGKLTAPFLYG